MSILPVRKVSLVAVKQDCEAMIAALQSAGVMHITAFKPSAIDNPLQDRIEAHRHKLIELSAAIEFLRRFQAAPGAIPPKGLSAERLLEQVSSIKSQSIATDHLINSLKSSIAIYSPFGEFIKSHDALIKNGLVLKLARLNQVELSLLKNQPAYYQVVSHSGDVNFVAILTKGHVDLNVNTFDPPKTSVPALRASLTEAETRSFTLKEEASRWAYQLRTLETLEEKTIESLDRLVELKKACTDGDLVGIGGFVLQRDVDQLKKALERQTIAISIEEPRVFDQVPVMLKNPRSIRGFEAIMKTFTGINYFEKDKTGVVSLLFMFFGSLCLLDAGYGFLLMVCGYVLAIKKNRDFGQVFMWTGAMSIIMGLLCGQVFGLTFAKDILFNIPPLLTLATDPMVCFKFSLLVGLLAMGLTNMVAIYQNGIATHATGCLLAIFGGVTWVIKQSGIFVGQFVDPTETLEMVSALFFSFGVISWLLYPEPVFGKDHRVANILWMLYAGPLGLIQDILSHMRLFGIALSGSILALVINKICALLPVPIGALFAPVGHFTIFLLSLLSLYIHTNRLIFLEFGSKCMSGGNNYFTPFTRRT